MKNYLLIDIGGSAVKYGLCDEQLNLSRKAKASLAPKSEKDIFYQTIQDILNQFEIEIEGVAISMPGLIDENTGFCFGSSMMKQRNVNIVDELQERLHLPVTIVNDGYAAAMAELGFGNMKDARNGAVIVLGTAIGGALIIDRRIHAGSHHTAGNYSFIFGDYRNPDDMGTMFAYTNGISGLSKAIFETSGIEDIDGIKAYQLIDEGNRDVEKGLELFCDYLAFHIYNLQVVLDLDRVLIGGGISNEKRTIDYIRRAIDKRWDAVRIPIAKPEIMNCKYNSDANLLGALYHYLQIHENAAK